MTRAMQKLYLTYAQMRRWNGTNGVRRMARFLHELPEDLLEYHSVLQTKSASALSSFKHAQPELSMSKQGNLRAGQKIKHETFGTGTILGFEGDGESLLVKIQFLRVGTKLLSPLYAKLDKI
jgi:DNA helicase-2/ATP-dependent DNA helicase PcrA